ncbi:MAG TPA: hypothetical protein VMF53_11740 [Alphaproteobacteria bacterium]|nr:hypothetical protein [Alphaproteobacteria bacterium]
MFYVSTVGSTASLWFARALSMHPEINCFHGVRSLAPQNGDSTSKEFVRSLTHLYFLCQGEKVFGSIHGYDGSDIEPEIRAIEGAYAGMIRHPIARIHSLFHREVPLIGTLELPPEDIYRPFREGALPDFHFDDFGIHFNPYARCFYTLCVRTIDQDTWMLERLDEAQIFRFERLVAERDYFRACFETIAEGCRHVMEINPRRPGPPRLKATERYLDKVFAMGVVNPKNTGATEVEEIFAAWPPFFKHIFTTALKAYGGPAAVERYARFGYALPKLSDAAAPVPAPEPTGPAAPVRIVYDQVGSVSNMVPARVQAVRRSDGSAFLGQYFTPSRPGATLEIRIKANAFAAEENAVALALFVNNRLNPAYFEVKPVAAGGWAQFSHRFRIPGEPPSGVAFEARIGPTRPGTVIINGPDGQPPDKIGFPELTIAELEA